jgi:hypothetical protein
VLFALVLIAEVGTTTTATSALAISTSTAGDSLETLLDEIGDAPLTEEELALLADLEARTSTPAVTATITRAFGIRPRTLVPRTERIETGARSVREALESLPVPWVSARMLRRRVLLEDVLLPTFMEGIVESDVRAFGLTVVSPRSSRVEHASGAHGTLALYGVVPEPGLHLEAAAEGRSADRASGLYGAAGGGVDVAAVRASVSYDDRRGVRTPAGESPHSKGERWVASLRAAFGGDFVLRGSIGADLDRAQNVRVVGDGGDLVGIMPLDQRLFTFGRIDAGEGRWGASLLGSYQRLDRSFEIEGFRVLDLGVEAVQGRLLAFVQPLDWLTLRGGAHVMFADAGELMHTRREIEGFLSIEVATPFLDALAAVRLAHQRSEGIVPVPFDGLGVLPEAALHIPIVGPLGVRGAFEMGMTVGAEGLLAPATLEERTVAFEGGPSLRGSSYALDLVVFSAWIDRPVPFVPDATSRDPPAGALRLAGVELEGSGRIGPVEILATGQLAEAVDRDTSRAAHVAPIASGLLAIRYHFDVRRAFLEARVRGASRPFEILGDEPSMDYAIQRRPLRAFARVGLAGGLDLGLGFEALLSIENALDRSYQLQTSEEPGAGIDLRATLAYVY